ncbi:alkaline phosphatase [Corynebacterium callunae]|uniref:alkaline phosphatase n=1 Tax=Corynebacterium callunae TaxID=1721 RepID=UPI00398206FA
MSFNRRRFVLSCAATSSIALVALSGTATAQSSFVSGSSGLFSSDSTPAAPEAPKNIIYMIGDGMGFNHVSATNLYETGQTRYQVAGEPGAVEALPGGEAVQVYEQSEWTQIAASSYQDGNSYDPARAWSDHNYVNENATDSAAAGTAMATGVKTTNGIIGMDPALQPVQNTSEYAIAQGKAAGVVSSVPFNHATPSAWAAHNSNRNDLHAIGEEMINSDLNVIMGAGHPFYDQDAKPVATADEDYMLTSQYERLANGETEFTFVEDEADFQALADGNVSSDKYFGLTQVADTLQHDRSGESVTPYDTPQNDVVDLATMSEAALNILNQDEDGFQVMIEGGAIDWAGHANDEARDIEEVQAFNAAVETVVEWVEENSSWEETLVIVTADHETGYLAGPTDDPAWSAMTGAAGVVPNHNWFSGNHTNQLVPMFVRGTGSEDIVAAADEIDPVRGKYIDNVEVAQITMNKWW